MDERMELSVFRTILTQMLHENRFSFCLMASKAPLRACLRFCDSRFDGLIWVLCFECCSPTHQSRKKIVGRWGWISGEKVLTFSLDFNIWIG